jgi:hypothetical protein
MQSFTAMSTEGIEAVKAAQRTQGVPYDIRVAGNWSEDYATLNTALSDGTDPLCAKLLTDLGVDYRLEMTNEEFEALVDALDDRFNHWGDDKAGSFLSGIAETLDIEFI